MGRGLLILATGLVIIVGLIRKAVSERLVLLPEITHSYHQEVNAQNISNSIMEYGVREIENDETWNSGFLQNNFMGATNVELQIFDYDDYDDDNPNIPPDHSITNWDRFTVLLVSAAQTQRATAVTEVAITKNSFSRFAYFTDFEPPNIYFFSGDVFNGPVHTNGQMRIAGSPVFNGPVSSPNMWQGHPLYNNNPQFNDTTDFDANPIQMPSSNDLQVLRNQGASGGLVFNNEINVEFKNNGTVDISQRFGNNWGPTNSYDLDLYNGIISSSQEVHVKGVLKGQVTLHSEEKIRISGDLTYSNNPLNNPNSTDMLGLISEGDVVVDQNAHEDSGNQDLKIHASIMALDESFEVEDYNDQTNSNEGPRGTLTLLGGIQQMQRGPVGTFSGNNIRSGYSKSYSYDQRLANTFPPFYPRVSNFSEVYWKEKPVEILN